MLENTPTPTTSSPLNLINFVELELEITAHSFSGVSARLWWNFGTCAFGGTLVLAGIGRGNNAPIFDYDPINGLLEDAKFYDICFYFSVH